MTGRPLPLKMRHRRPGAGVYLAIGAVVAIAVSSLNDVFAQDSGALDQATKTKRDIASAAPAFDFHQEATEKSPASSPQIPARHRVSELELNRTARQLPKGAFREFHLMQNEVVGRCIECHDSSNESFALFGPFAQNEYSRVDTKRNLREVLRHLDTNRPGDSPILKQMLEPHGDMTVAPVVDDEPLYRRFRYWVFYVARKQHLWRPLDQVANASAGKVEFDSIPTEADPSTRSTGATTEHRDDPAQATNLVARPDTIPDLTSATAAPDRLSPRRPRENPDKTDPFDAEPFNREFAGQKNRHSKRPSPNDGS